MLRCRMGHQGLGGGLITQQTDVSLTAGLWCGFARTWNNCDQVLPVRSGTWSLTVGVTR